MARRNLTPVSASCDRLAREVVDAAFKVHSALGPGLLESVYETCLAYELEKRGLEVRRQVQAPVVYDALRVEAGLRVDLLVGGDLIVELKAVDRFSDVHVAQVLTYLKLLDKQLGLLVNFNVALLKDGIRRVVR